MIELSQYYLLLILFLFNGLWIIGFNAATRFETKSELIPNKDKYGCDGCKDRYWDVPVEDSKMVLWWVKYYAEKWFGEYWSKPICNCMVCMPSIHGLWYWALYPTSGNLLTDILTWVFYVMCLAGVMKIVSVKIDL